VIGHPAQVEKTLTVHCCPMVYGLFFFLSPEKSQLTLIVGPSFFLTLFLFKFPEVVLFYHNFFQGGGGCTSLICFLHWMVDCCFVLLTFHNPKQSATCRKLPVDFYDDLDPLNICPGRQSNHEGIRSYSRSFMEVGLPHSKIERETCYKSTTAG